MSSARIRYAYLKGHTWLYRRNYTVRCWQVRANLSIGTAALPHIRHLSSNTQGLPEIRGWM